MLFYGSESHSRRQDALEGGLSTEARNPGLAKAYLGGKGGNWDPPRESRWLEAHSQATMVYELQNFPGPPWKEITLDYQQGGEGSVTKPSQLHCALKGDTPHGPLRPTRRSRRLE